jgi:uncharacterized protein YjbI with pentapeptide repeats
MTAGRGSKKFVFSRREPDLPAEWAVEARPDAWIEGRDIAISERRVDGQKWEGHTAGTLNLEGCILERVSLANCAFGSIRMKDVRLAECDLANLETRGLTLIRVELLQCRMTGLRAGEADCQDVLIGEGDQRYSLFRFSRFRSAEFDSCNFEEADFQGTDLSGARFRKCNLRNAEMSKVKLPNADLRGSLVEGLRLNAEDLRGATVDAAQALIFAGLLGIRIE